MTVVFFDLETGGLAAHHPDIQLAAVAVTDDLSLVVDEFEAKIRFDPDSAQPEALALNSYDAKTWERDGRSCLEVVEDFGAFLRHHATVKMRAKSGRTYYLARLAGHNASTFDGPRLKAMFDRFGKFLPGTWYQVLDTYQLALWHFLRAPGPPPENLQVQTLARHFSTEGDGPAHDALADVRTTVAVARKLLDPA